MKERRNTERRVLSGYPSVLDRSSARILGYVSNMSVDGAMLVGEQPIEANSVFELSMLLPSEIQGKWHLDFEAISVWCKKNSHPPLYRAGFKLRDLDSTDLEIVKQLCLGPGEKDRRTPNIKRMFDILASTVGLLILWPVFLGVGLLLRLESNEPAFYKAARVGQFGRLFQMYKFRTMVEEPENNGPRITAHDDPRITRLGRFLRQTKLNELPQLLNVIKGEMSLVGPRPEDEEFVPHYTSEQRKVLSVKPGITSLASILYSDEERMLQFSNVIETYLRSILPEKLRLDLMYIRNRSMLLDIDILIRTALVLIPRFRHAAPRVEDVLMGPLRKARRYITWLAIDAIIAVLAIGTAGAVWRSVGPLNIGFAQSMVAALLMTGLFVAANWATGTQRVEWRYASPVDAIAVIGSAAVATLLMALLNSILPAPRFPIEMLMMSGLFAASGFLIARYHRLLISGLRSLDERLRMPLPAGRERVIIVGAGDAGQFTVRLLQDSSAGRIYELVGIVDDDIDKLGALIHRVPVLGVCDHIGDIVQEQRISTIIFAIHSIKGIRRESILERCQETPARVVVVPDLISFLKEGASSAGNGSFLMNSHLIPAKVGEADQNLRSKIRELAKLARSGDLEKVSKELAQMDAALRTTDAREEPSLPFSDEYSFLRQDSVMPSSPDETPS